MISMMASLGNALNLFCEEIRITFRAWEIKTEYGLFQGRLHLLLMFELSTACDFIYSQRREYPQLSYQS